MATKIFVNLPVKDLEKSKAFFSQLGYTFNAQLTDNCAACIIIADNIFVMLLSETFFKSFTHKELADNTKTTETIICLSAESKQAVIDLVAKAVAAGGKIYKVPQDYGFMYGHSFEDIDGHLWEIMWMEERM